MGFPVRMDLDRFGILQVHLDEAYDQIALQLQIFYKAVAQRSDLAQFQRFARGFARSMGREVIADLVLGLGAGPGKERTGLMALLPELEVEFGRLGTRPGRRAEPGPTRAGPGWDRERQEAEALALGGQGEGGREGDGVATMSPCRTGRSTGPR